MFSGRWATVEPLALDGGQRVRLELGIGHFGPDLVGVMRLSDALGAPLADCPCAIVEGARVSLEAATFSAFADLCEAVHAHLDPRWGLALSLDDEAAPRRLSGSLTRASGVQVELALEEVDSFVDPAFKVCP
jgi:hypothetical protein